MGIDHPEASKHGRRVYVNAQDVEGGEPLRGGARVSFFAYTDGDGIGAEEVQVEDEGEETSDASPPRGAPGHAFAPCDEDDWPALPGHSTGWSPSQPRGRWGGWNGWNGWNGWGSDDGGGGLVRRTIDKPGLPDGPKGWGKGKGKGKTKGKGKGKGYGKGVVLLPGPGRGPDRGKTVHSDAGQLLRWASCEMRGWRPSMEDAMCALLDLEQPLQRHALFGVFDGHGGSAVSRRAAAELPSLIVGHAAGLLSSSSQDGVLAETAFKLALPAWDATLRQSGDGELGFLPVTAAGTTIPSDVKNAYALTGSTAVLALLECTGPPRESQPVRVTVANCGDSRAVLCRGGEAIALSEDQKPDMPEESARIERAGGFVAPVGPCHRIDGWGLNLSRALGDFHYKARDDLPPEDQKVSCVPEVTTCELTEQDEFLLLGCDGVFELYTSQEVVDLVRAGLLAGKQLNAVLEELVDSCCSRDLMETQGRGGDNVSAMVIMLH